MIQWTHWVLEHISWRKEEKECDFMLGNISQIQFILQEEKHMSQRSCDEQEVLVSLRH